MAATTTSEPYAFRRIAWLLPAAFALHEAEEWNILSWYRAHYPDLPRATAGHVRLGLFTYVVIGLLWTLVAVRLRSPRATAFTLLPLVLFLLSNAFQHVYWTVHLAAYDPGLITAVVLVAPVAGVIIWRAMRQRLVPAWYVAVLVLVNAPTLAETIGGDRMVRFQMQMVNDLGAALARLF